MRILACQTPLHRKAGFAYCAPPDDTHAPFLEFEKLVEEGDRSEQVSIDSKDRYAKYLERMKKSL